MSRLKNTLSLFLLCVSLFGALTSHAQDAAADTAKIHTLLDGLEVIFAKGDIDGAMQAFTGDAIIFAENGADIVGAEAIRAAYSGMMSAFNVELAFNTAQVEVLGDTAYEQGTFSIKLTDKVSGQVASDTTSRHIHILKRQADGSWKTWRMMSNTPAPAATAQ
jgi:ketosteroid isomerase-like protein